MRTAVLVALALALCGCELVYKLPTRQGNVIEQKELDTLELGMSREQVQFLLGTPIASSVFRENRWDYVGYYRNQRGRVFSRTVSLFFEDGKLARMEGQQPVGNTDSKPDLEAIEKEEQKAATEEERAQEKTDSGIVITPK